MDSKPSLKTRLQQPGLIARARVEMKAAETVIHLRREMPSRMKNMVPSHVWHLVKLDGMGPKDSEQR
jgi:coenzyme F420 hydrogenase subunit beta